MQFLAPDEKPKFDPAPLRIAMEHMLSHQQMPLDKAAACFVIYSVRLVWDYLGREQAQVVLNTAIHHLECLTESSAEERIQ